LWSLRTGCDPSGRAV